VSVEKGSQAQVGRAGRIVEARALSSHTPYLVCRVLVTSAELQVGGMDDSVQRPLQEVGCGHKARLGS